MIARHRVGQFLRGALHDNNEIFRYGGDELVIIQRADAASPIDLAERVLHGWRLLNPTTTLSIGIAVHLAGRSLAQTFGEADSALYEAKRSGRNQVRLWSGGIPSTEPPQAPAPERRSA